MSARIKEELQDNASVKLKITVPKQDVKNEYDSLVQDYRQKISVKGFRKGKVPREVLIRKFGESLKGETAQNLIEKNLQAAFEKVQYKPLPYSMPELKDKVELDLEKSLSFEVTYDTFPDIQLGTYKDIEIEEPVVTVGDADINRELQGIQEQNAIVVDKESGKVEDGDTVTIDYVELDEQGNEQTEKRREGFTFTVGSGYNIHKIDQDILDMTIEEERVIEKDYPENFENSDLAGKKIRLKVKIVNVKEKNLPKIDDELAQDVSDRYQTLDDLKGDIRKRLKETLEARLKDTKILQLLGKVAENSTIPLPNSMVQQELAQRWQGFIRQFRADEETMLQMLQEQGKTREELQDEWRPGAEDALKMKLVENRIIEEEKTSVDDAEVEEELKRQAELREKSVDEVREEYTKEGMLDYLKENLKTQKAHDGLLESAKVKKGKKVKFLDFIQGKS